MKDGIDDAKEQMEIMGSKNEEEVQRQRQQTVSLLWNQEREKLVCEIEELALAQENPVMHWA